MLSIQNPELRRLLQILNWTVVIALMVWMFRQVRKPSGPLGRRTVRAMNLGHAKMTDWGLEQVIAPKNARILDVGCGGGRTVGRLATLAPDGKIIGLDYSAASVAVARDTNAREIETGRVRILHGSVAALPFSDSAFDAVTAVETHYYWPDLPANMREILRVLKPGGTFTLIAETYRGGPLRLLYGIVMPLIRAAFLTAEEHRELLSEAGFAEVTTLHVPGKNWICATGRRPAVGQGLRPVRRRQAGGLPHITSACPA